MHAPPFPNLPAVQVRRVLRRKGVQTRRWAPCCRWPRSALLLPLLFLGGWRGWERALAPLPLGPQLLLLLLLLSFEGWQGWREFLLQQPVHHAVPWLLSPATSTVPCACRVVTRPLLSPGHHQRLAIRLCLHVPSTCTVHLVRRILETIASTQNFAMTS